ncbi:MAG TPA: hypothetical protein PK579_19935, partial [Phycisphaerae bacterium]|nr:hypothetical protein [Phycisphaerae bacterium]
MIQCSDCEYFHRGPGGRGIFSCDPFSTIKEPECLAKWQLIKMEIMVRSHQATMDMYRRLAPLQEKLFRQMERELDDQEEADKWKYGLQEEDDDELEDE